MRITSAQMYNTLLTGVKQQQDILNQGNAQIASGTKFQTPDQAGIAYKTSLDIRHAQVGLQGDLDSITTADSRLANSMTMLNDMTNIMKRAQTVAVQMATASTSATERLSAAQEATQLLNQAFNDANQQWQGQSLFAGTATDKAAFVTDTLGNIVYNGNAQDRTIVTSDGQQVITNIRGDNPAFAAAFSALQDFKTALQNNDTAGVQNAVGALTSASDGVINMTSDVGARLNGVRLNKTAIQDRQLNLATQLNTNEAVDIPSVVARMQQSSIALQAAYSQINQIKSLTLTNFLR
ncbi:flagellar hook-associated protein [Mariprofundus ferrooxydans]|uniref:Flagellar hook-associated protein n=1 Tax=Mariprofundus ferrooxydans PV-1 TaxID=314345 RepID=Q0EYE0_9PROT|nr:flagellar hook-associated protein [Mariprofundus ferrooxydans]EAU54252.1 flagellar hook-associated protein [Mariprofundus ferrooxydans PV-1]KON47799.1 hypothetical protein AL013_06185 [Mariprofundus ferrooxydans]